RAARNDARVGSAAVRPLARSVLHVLPVRGHLRESFERAACFMSGLKSRARIALLGGLYSNYLALEAALAKIARRGVDAVYCLGDLGAFGPHPDRVFPLLEQSGVVCIQGNYDHSIGHQLDDCRCGYTDPRDNYFAQISYDYTL